MSIRLKTIIADDEPLGRKGMENFVREMPMLELVRSCEDAFQVMEVLADQKIDLIFLDIQMPKMTGMEFLHSLNKPPMTIITTAYPQYALEGYELNVIDYLVKPIPLERFVKAVNKAVDYFALLNNKTGLEYFFVKADNKYEKIFIDDILYVEAMQNYVIIHTSTRRVITYLTFKGVSDYLPSDKFIRVHKSFIVSIPKIDRIDGNEIHIGKNVIAISRQNKDEVMAAILDNKFLKR
jgi:DNA-binding LytR/AlgR family response regulator